MEDTAKLKHLVEHWFQHNDQHARTFDEWADRMKAAGRDDVAVELSHLSRATRQLDDVLKRLERLL